MASESESEKRETLADIAAEMRTRSREVKEAFGGRTDGVENMLDIWADRIEAAWKREKAKIEADALTVGGIVEAARKREREPVTGCHGFGNAAAMREALETIHDKVNSLDEECGVDPVEIRDIASAALSAPARQCDVGTPEEQEARYKMTGEVYHTLTLKNALAWAQMPYEANE